MESSKYLQAIQDVPGLTPGEKYRTLNCIARKMIAASKGQSNSIQVQSSPELPELLIPLVKIEIAKIVQQPDGIVEALKSNDTSVFNRALQAKWFFDGSMKNVTNIDYYLDHILDWISVMNRKKLITTLYIHLMRNKQHAIAEAFYVTLSKMYGTKQSENILLACSETFIWDMIVKRKLVLPVRIIKILYLKYPDIIVKYLRLGIPDTDRSNFNAHIPMNDYVDFLPRLLNHHTDIFIELIVKIPYVLRQKMSRICMDKLMKNRVDAIILHACLFAPSVNLKYLTSKLTKEQFKLFFRNLFPTNGLENEFRFMEMYNYLEHYPCEEKVPLLLSTFEEVYKTRFVDVDILLTPEVLRLLPPEDRVMAVRKKLANNLKNLPNYYGVEEVLICYLPISESIPIIKNYISKTSDAESRRQLLERMIYSCKVNNDENSLLEVLKYIETRHKNERGDILLLVINRLLQDFQVHNLSSQHWKILDNIIQILHVKDELVSDKYTVKLLISAKIQYNLIHNLPIVDPIKFYFTIEMNEYFPIWNIIQDQLQYEKRCLEEFLSVAPTIYPQKMSKVKLIDSFLIAINSFNKRNLEGKCKIEAITIKKFSWLLQEIPTIINSDEKAIDKRFIMNLKECDADLYHVWMKNNEQYEMINLQSVEEFNIWRRNPQKIANHWEKYMEECEYAIHKKYVQRFIKVCRWHQNLPIKFAEKCLKNVTENKSPHSLIVLALLFEGSAFERVITPFLPTSATIDIQSEDAKKSYAIMQSIPKALSIVNPPVSLNITLQLCKGDTIHMAANWLTMLSRQTPVNEFIPFAINMMNQPVSISKHFIRNFSIAANIAQLHDVLINLWRKEKHYTIRTMVLEKIFDLFVSNPNATTWLLMNECIDEFTSDDIQSLKYICCLGRVPKEYVADYVKKLWITSKIFKRINNSLDPDIIWLQILKLLQCSKNIAILLPEELHQEILQTYFTDLLLPLHVLEAAQYYLINAYINPAGNELESRLTFYSNLFTDILKNQWDVPDPKRTDIYPANYMVDSLMVNILHHIDDDHTRARFIDVTLKAFLSVLNPLQAPVFYSYFVFASCYRQNMSGKIYAQKIGEIIPLLIETFSISFIGNLSEILEKCLKLSWEKNKSQDDLIFDLIDGLLELNNEHVMMLAAALVKAPSAKLYERYARILKTLRHHENPSIVAWTSMYINSRI